MPIVEMKFEVQNIPHDFESLGQMMPSGMKKGDRIWHHKWGRPDAAEIERDEDPISYLEQEPYHVWRKKEPLRIVLVECHPRESITRYNPSLKREENLVIVGNAVDWVHIRDTEDVREHIVFLKKGV